MEILDIVIIIMIISIIPLYYILLYPVIDKKFEKYKKKSIILKAHPDYDSSSLHFALIIILIFIFIGLLNYFFR
jgi:hypothetical protein